MVTPWFRRFSLAALILVSVLITPASVGGQCSLILSPVVVGMPGAMTITVSQAFTGGGSQVCVATVSNAYGCYPSLAPDTMNVSFLLASAMTASTMTMGVSCVWSCGCGTVTIDGGDGLPVELMDFSVE